MSILNTGFANPRPDLADAWYQYTNSGLTRAATQVFPTLAVDTQAGEIEVVTRKSLLGLDAPYRAVNGNYNRINVSLDKMTYAARDYGLEHAINMADGASIQYNKEVGAVNHLWLKLALAEEVATASLVFNGTTFTGADLFTTVGTAWSDPTADIIGDVIDAAEKVRRNTGVKANALVVSAVNAVNMMKNDGIRAALNGVVVPTVDVISAAAPALFGLQKVIVGDAVYDAAGSGHTFNGTDVWSADYAFVCKAANEGDPIEVPCIGRNLFWADDSGPEYTIENYYETQTRSMVYRARHNATFKLFDPYFGHLLDVTAQS